MPTTNIATTPMAKTEGPARTRDALAAVGTAAEGSGWLSGPEKASPRRDVLEKERVRRVKACDQALSG